MRVLSTPEATRDRTEVWGHIAADDPLAAVRMDQLFEDAAARLAGFPMLGRAGKVPGTRELYPHESYRLVHEIEGDTVWVPALIHARRQWPSLR